VVRCKIDTSLFEMVCFREIRKVLTALLLRLPSIACSTYAAGPEPPPKDKGPRNAVRRARRANPREPADFDSIDEGGPEGGKHAARFPLSSFAGRNSERTCAPRTSTRLFRMRPKRATPRPLPGPPSNRSPPALWFLSDSSRLSCTGCGAPEKSYKPTPAAGWLRSSS